MLREYSEIKSWLDSMDIMSYEIHDTGTVTVDCDVGLYRKGLTTIPVQFRTVYGYFDCGNNYLKTLDGSPREVGGNFNCSNNNFTTIPDDEYCKIAINGRFNWNG